MTLLKKITITLRRKLPHPYEGWQSFLGCNQWKHYLPSSQMRARVQVADTTQQHLMGGDCVKRAFMVELLLRNHYRGRPTRGREPRAKKHKKWLFKPMETWNSVGWVHMWEFWFQSPRVCEIQRRKMDGVCMCGSNYEQRGGGGTVCVYWELKATLKISLLQEWRQHSGVTRHPVGFELSWSNRFQDHNEHFCHHNLVLKQSVTTEGWIWARNQDAACTQASPTLRHALLYPPFYL